MIFHPGQHVICVDAKATDGLLVESQEYIIDRGNYNGLVTNGVYVSLVGVAEAYKPYNGFRISRFRPIIKRSTETGMAILLRIVGDATAPRLKKELVE